LVRNEQSDWLSVGTGRGGPVGRGQRAEGREMTEETGRRLRRKHISRSQEKRAPAKISIVAADQQTALVEGGGGEGRGGTFV
jgi:hypothetical protein